MATLALMAALNPLATAQINNAVAVGPMTPFPARRGAAVSVKLPLIIKPGFHINGDKPNDPYLIPLRVTWTPTPFELTAITYPKTTLETYPFSDKPMAVLSGDVHVVTDLKVPATAPKGESTITGKLRYQACNSKMCLAPKTVDVQAVVVVQ